jgi:hypothetical protein
MEDLSDEENELEDIVGHIDNIPDGILISDVEHVHSQSWI